MKKLIALVLAGVMVFSLPVMAGSSPTTQAVVSSSVSSESSPSGSSESGEPAYINGIPYATVAAAAAAEGKSVGEYLNNVIVTVPGLQNLTVIGQGGHVIINGAPSNQVFSVMKPSAAAVNSAKAYAASLGGRIMNVVDIKASVRNFETARVNFYAKGVVAGQKIKVFCLVNGQWVELNTAEIRLDHVVVDMTGLGTLLFVELP